MNGTPSGNLNWQEIGWTLRDALLLAVAFFVTELAARVGNLDFGRYTPLVVVAVAWIANVVKVWVGNNTGQPPPPGPAQPPTM